MLSFNFVRFVLAIFCGVLPLVSFLSPTRVVRGDVGVSLHGWSAVQRQLVLELRRQMLGFHLSPEKEKRFFSPPVAFCASARERNFDSDFLPTIAIVLLHFI